MNTLESSTEAAKSTLALLGSLWRYYYGERKLVLSMVQANLEVLKQQQQNLSEAAACADRHAVPLFHTENWLLLYSNKGPTGRAVLHKPPGLVELPLIMDKAVNPTLVLHAGIDYRIDSKKITLSPSASHHVTTDTLWGFKAKFDRTYLWTYFGHLVGLKDQTSQQYKDTINAIIDCWLYGPSVARLEALITAVLGVPCADGKETICGRYEDRRGPFVVTDLRVHRIPQDAILSHSEGSQPYPGAPLVRAFEIREAAGTAGHEVLVLVAPQYANENLPKIIRMVFPPFIRLTFGRLS